MVDFEEVVAEIILIGTCIVIVIGYIVAAIAGLGMLIESEDTITVEERVGAHGENGIYLIITEEGETFTVQDNILKLKFDASDRYAAIKPGVRYHVTCTGWRVQILSWYRNVIESTPVTENVTLEG